MKTMERNKTAFWYMTYADRVPVTDEYGNETGEYEVTYNEPAMLRANISPATGSSQVEQFGSLAGYDKVIVTDDVSCPIDENSVLFIDKAVEFTDDGKPLYDYTVKRVARSLNSVSYAVTKVSVS